MRPSTAVPTALNRTRTALELCYAGTAWLAGRAVAGGRRLGSRATALTRGPLRTLLLGRRRAVSVALVGLGVLLAAVTAWSVAATTGYPPLEQWVGDTWDGTDPRPVVFAGVAALFALAAAGAAANAGLVPTTALVAGPLFGLGLTRYATVVSTGYGQYVVSLPDALAFAAGLAAIGGSGIAVAGYAVGAGLRRAARIVGADPSVPLPRRRN